MWLLIPVFQLADLDSRLHHSLQQWAVPRFRYLRADHHQRLRIRSFAGKRDGGRRAIFANTGLLLFQLGFRSFVSVFSLSLRIELIAAIDAEKP